MASKQASLVGGISILGIAGLICKVVGVLYLIPLANLIGPEGMGVYNQVFPSYNLMLTISSVGIPVAISRMVAARTAKQESRNPNRVFRAALVILSILGFISTLLMMLFSDSFAKATGTPESVKGFLAIAPSLFLVCVMSAFRGFMQGRRRMWPTAISQLIEQVGKVAVALPLAYSFMSRGDYAMGVAGALLGTSLAEAAALLYMAVDYVFYRPQLCAGLLTDTRPMEPYPAITRELVLTAIPITIGACIVPLAGTVDSFMLVRLMKAYLPEQVALSNYGIYAGLVISLINVPTALAMAMSSNLVPSISAKRELKDKEGIQRDSMAGLRLAMVVGLPSSVGMSLLALPIMTLLFHSKYTMEQLRLGAELLQISSLTIVVFTLVQASSGILQGLYKQRIPMYTLALGVAVKIIINYTAVQLPSVSIYGAPWASLTSYVISAGLNIYYVAKYAGLKLDLRDLLLKPFLATLVMAVPVLLVSRLMGNTLNRNWLALGLVILFAVALYLMSALKLGAIKQQDLPARFQKR
ncbi:MAG: polysaccharide biosynthesis protein [Clostridiales bacterium]|jgi:stage V sporulation protein B|nr:polysaccharide biosynthesis protein [Clostridiales bacterium]